MLEDFADFLTEFDLFAVKFADDMPRPEKRFGNRRNPAILTDKIGRSLLQIGARLGPGENFGGELFEPLFPRRGGKRLLFRLIRKIKILQPPSRSGVADSFLQFRRQLAERLDRAENRLFPFGQKPELPETFGDLPEVFLIEVPRRVFSITGDKRDRMPLVEKPDRCFNTFRGEGKIMRQVRQADRDRFGHKIFRLRSASGGDKMTLCSLPLSAEKRPGQRGEKARDGQKSGEFASDERNGVFSFDEKASRFRLKAGVIHSPAKAIGRAKSSSIIYNL